jgi:hypothetical protein
MNGKPVYVVNLSLLGDGGHAYNLYHMMDKFDIVWAKSLCFKPIEGELVIVYITKSSHLEWSDIGRVLTVILEQAQVIKKRV